MIWRQLQIILFVLSPSGVAQGTCYEDLISQVNHVERQGTVKGVKFFDASDHSQCEPLYQQCYESVQCLPWASGLSVPS